MLDPNVVLRVDSGAAGPGTSQVIRGASATAKQALMFSHPAPFSRPALVNGAAGLVRVRDGQPFSVIGFTVTRGKIVEINLLADPERLRLDPAVLND